MNETETILYGKKILLHVSGSIAAYKACSLVSMLKKEGCLIQVSSSKHGMDFSGKAAFEGLTGYKVLTDSFDSCSDTVIDAQNTTFKRIPHIDLAQNWADLIMVYPASASCIRSLAYGGTDSLFTDIFLANNFLHPVLVAPAMNTAMFNHPSLKESLEKLEEWGTIILPSGTGELACGANGEGRLLEPEDAVFYIKKELMKTQILQGKKILITGGGCEESLDTIRSICNTSTGKTAAFIADFLAEKGCEVTALFSKRSLKPTAKNVYLEEYKSCSDLFSKIKNYSSQKKHYDLIIHCAAVSDFTPSEIVVNGIVYTSQTVPQKLPSDARLEVRFQKNPKIIDDMRSFFPYSKICAFKLTSGASLFERKEAVKSLLNHSHVDYVCSNDADEIKNEVHPFTMYKNDGSKVVSGNNLNDMVVFFESLL